MEHNERNSRLKWSLLSIKEDKMKSSKIEEEWEKNHPRAEEENILGLGGILRAEEKIWNLTWWSSQ